MREGERAPKCKRCPFAVDGKPCHQPVRPDEPEGKPLGVLVGEGPGKDEVDHGRPFIGMTGQELDERLEEVKLDRTKLLVINAMGCMPPAGVFRSEATMRDAAKACRPWMLSILRNNVPTDRSVPALAMGKWAGFLVTGKAKAIGGARGFLRRTKRLNPLILTWHPTFALFRNPWEAGNFLTDLDRFARATRHQLRPLPRVNINPTVEDLKHLLKAPFVTVDIETGAAQKDKPWTGKDPTQNTLKVMGLGVRGAGFAIWWDKAQPGVQRLVRKILASEDILKVWQNGEWFDKRVLHRLGFKLRNCMADTRTMRRAISTTSKLSLSYMGSIYCDLNAWKEKADDGKE